MDKNLKYCRKSNLLITGTKNDQACLSKEMGIKLIPESEIAINGQCNSINILISPSIPQNERLCRRP